MSSSRLGAGQTEQLDASRMETGRPMNASTATTSDFAPPKETAPEESGPSLTDYCDFCLKIIECIPNRSEKPSSVYDFIKSTTYRQTAEHCRLCQFVVTYLEDSNDGEHVDIMKIEESEALTQHRVLIYSYPSERRHDAHLYVKCYCKLVLPRPEKWNLVAFALWAQEGSSASFDIVTRQPMLTFDAGSITDTVKDWYDECTTQHNKCNIIPSKAQALPGDYAKLPTRILEICGKKDGVFVRLIESCNRRGNYFALSHCWGNKDKQPLKTTTWNKNEHMLGIDYVTLPKTFQDAVLVTLRLGARYLWIDSLCIIQDDAEDWKHESQTMGLLYKKATLVLAAAGSTDSSGGLFMAGRPSSCIMQLPYIRNGTATGTFNVSRIPASTSKTKLDDGPLRGRGWALQEWYFAPRLAFFTAESILWKCRSKELEENGGRVALLLPKDLSWLYLLQEYSSKHLTHVSDRLVAIQGIVNEEQRYRTSRFINGIWEDSITSELLWYIKNHDVDNDWYESPSWSWVSKGGEKIWVMASYSGWHKDLPQELHFSDQNSLRVTGKLIDMPFDGSHLPYCCLIQSYLDVPRKLLSDMVLLARPVPVLQESSHRSDMYGLASFDDEELAYTQCLLILQTGYDCNSTPEFPTFKANASESIEEHEEHGRHQGDKGANCIDFSKIDRYEYVYWGLLLKAVGEAKYKRVGMAMLYPNIEDLIPAEDVSFEVV